MTLTLTIRNVDRLDNGQPPEFVLHRRGAMIGRAATCDWSLPDPRNYISSRHGEVTFRDGFYYFNDVSTNGTFLNGAGDRMSEPRRIEQDDLFLIGHYEMVAALSGAAVVAVEREEEQAAEQAQQAGGFSWNAHGDSAPPPDVGGGGGWGDAPPANSGLTSGAGGASAQLDGSWGAPAAPPSGSDSGWRASSEPADNGWGGGAPSAPESGEGWGAPTPAGGEGGGSDWSAPAPSSNDGWGAPAASGNSGGGEGPAWAPASGPSLSAPTPYAARGGGGSAAPQPSVAPMDSSNSWAPAQQEAEERGPSPWDSAQAPIQQSSAWSSAVSDRPKASTPNDIWGSMANSNVVDWARADFGGKPEENKDPLGLEKPKGGGLPKELPRAPMADNPPAVSDGGWGSDSPTPTGDRGWGSDPASSHTPTPERAPARSAPAAAAPAPAPVARPTSAAPPATPVSGGGTGDPAQTAIAFAVAAGLKPEQLKQPSAETLARAALLMRRLISGLVVMVEARARAKSQMGAEQTGLEFDGNNPIKFARTPEQALAQLLNPPERGFMPAEKAIEDAYFDLQSHQMATLKAMQGALRATLDRFSPAAIRKRAETGGFLSRLLPGGKDATLWHTYEREFSGVAQGSDEAFMDVFAKEFRQAYDEQSRNRNK